ncbi:Hypothetical predicted protein [Octopus vulgaris]|uniref:Uncharacterized protein n=1 Tax=Octopus vulgaris TaxID=6645 RepID=A0AA36ASZ5_OCTVU|nr:Hypothetical predicted protein [Octopus vulgaris]
MILTAIFAKTRLALFMSDSKESLMVCPCKKLKLLKGEEMESCDSRDLPTNIRDINEGKCLKLELKLH